MDLSESSLFQMAESLLAKLSSSSIQQASLHIGVSNDVHDFQMALSSLKDRLWDVDYERQLSYLLQRWLRKLKQLFYDAENMLDDIHCQSSFRGEKKQGLKAHHHHHHEGGTSTSTTAVTKVRHFFSSPTPAMATQINDITERLQHCAADKIVIDTHLQSKREISQIALLPSFFDRNVMGREIDKEIIIEKLLMHHHHDDDDQSLSILPIVGTGGLGKTTLAQIVFRDERIRKSFSEQMWLCVSHFDIEKFIIQMIDSGQTYFDIEQVINQATKSGGTFFGTPYQPVKKLLANKLAGKKFLLVLDDVWEEDPLKWNEFRNLIPTGVNGSKVLLTTRSHSIASMTGTIPSHNLEPLSLKDSLSLCEKFAAKEEAEKYPNLIEIGREIVNRCGGVPLTIKTIHEMVEWESTSYHEFRDLPKVNGILPAIKLSYHYIPFHLKQCFELFSLYPNDFVFHSSEVVSLWAALDLLPSPNIDETLKDVAYRCLQELMPRSFLKKFVNFGTSYFFQIHDSVHDLARDMAKYECIMVNSYSQFIPENVRHLSFDIPENVRHLSFYVYDSLHYFFSSKYADVRSILSPVEGVGATSEDFLNMWVSRYKYLRILDLSDSTYEILPSSIGKLRHLRFLSLERNKKIKRVPDSICKLQNLQVLNLAGCTELEKLPKPLRKLTSLRQLGITTKESTLPENDIANLISLEVLNIESCDKLESFFLRIKLPALKTLEVTNCGSLKHLPLDIDHFPHLETLLIDNCGYLELAKRHGDQNSNLRLKAIRLHSLPQMMNLPHWLKKSINTLQSLLIVDCNNLETLPEWLSTLSFLVSLGIVNCPKLKSLPSNIHHLIALGYLRIEGCPILCRKLQPQVGEYWYIISHIKQVFIGEPQDLKEEEEEREDD